MFIKKYKAKGLIWLKKENDTVSGSIVKFLTEENIKAIEEKMNFANDVLLCIYF